MRKIQIILVSVLLMLLSACSFLDTVNDSVEYVNTAKDHLNNLATFAEEAPTLMESAVNNPEAKQDLETKLVTLKQDIEEFINMKNIPSVAESIHQELVSKNQVLLDEINKVIEDGHLAIEKLENSQIITTINEATLLMERVESLTQ